jgi:hypothetical protein
LIQSNQRLKKKPQTFKTSLISALETLETKQNHKKMRTSLAIALSKTSEKQALVLSPNNSSLSQHALNRFLGTLVLS